MNFRDFVIIAWLCLYLVSCGKKMTEFNLKSEGLTKDGLILVFDKYPSDWSSKAVFGKSGVDGTLLRFSNERPEGFSDIGVRKTLLEREGDLQLLIPFDNFRNSKINVIIEGNEIGEWELKK